MEGLPNGGLLLGTRFQLEELQADSRRIQQQTRDRAAATAAIVQQLYLSDLQLLTST